MASYFPIVVDLGPFTSKKHLFLMEGTARREGRGRMRGILLRGLAEVSYKN